MMTTFSCYTCGHVIVHDPVYGYNIKIADGNKTPLINHGVCEDCAKELADIMRNKHFVIEDLMLKQKLNANKT